jgi:hypothetical protein
MRDVTAELKDLRLHGMASVWADLAEQDASGVGASRWLVEHLLQAENTDRGSVALSKICQMRPQ